MDWNGGVNRRETKLKPFVILEDCCTGVCAAANQDNVVPEVSPVQRKMFSKLQTLSVVGDRHKMTCSLCHSPVYM